MKRLLFVLALVLFYIAYIYKNNTWASFVTQGSAYGNILRYKNTFIIGTSAHKLYFLDINNPNNASDLDLNNFDVNPQAIIGKNVIVSANDSLFEIRIDKKQKKWKFVEENGYDFEKVAVSGSLIFATSKDGSLYALEIGSGNKKWKFSPSELENLTDIQLGNRLYYFVGKGKFSKIIKPVTQLNVR